MRDIYGKTSGVAQFIIRGIICHSPDFIMKAFITHVRPIIDFPSVVWCVGYIGDLHLLESVQRRFTKKIEGLECELRRKTFDSGYFFQIFEK